MNNDSRSEVEQEISRKGKSADFSLAIMSVQELPGMPEYAEIDATEILRGGKYNKLITCSENGCRMG